MTDLGPMPPCIAGRNGKHELSAIIPETADAIAEHVRRGSW